VKAIVLTAPSRIEVRDVAEPDQGGDALIQLERAGICGTDVKIFHGDIAVRHPRIMGHEFVGSVARPGAQGLHPTGARVLVDPAISCGHCRQCRADRPNLCPNGALMGRDVDGVFAERIVVDEQHLHRVPDTITPGAAALLQVLGTCVHAQAAVGTLPGRAAACPAAPGPGNPAHRRDLALAGEAATRAGNGGLHRGHARRGRGRHP
jgi:threonine dehydrogenase-like Zn-dependent dehydrogenase